MLFLSHDTSTETRDDKASARARSRSAVGFANAAFVRAAEKREDAGLAVRRHERACHRSCRLSGRRWLWEMPFRLGLRAFRSRNVLFADAQAPYRQFSDLQSFDTSVQNRETPDRQYADRKGSDRDCPECRGAHRESTR